MKILRRDNEKDYAVGRANEKSSTKGPTSKGDIHSIERSIAVEAKIAALMGRIEALEGKRMTPHLNYVNQISAPSCFNCHSPTNVLKDCPLLPNPLVSNQDQLNAAFQCQRSETFVPNLQSRVKESS